MAENVLIRILTTILYNHRLKAGGEYKPDIEVKVIRLFNPYPYP